MVGYPCSHFTCSYHLFIGDLGRGQEKQQPSGVKFWTSGTWHSLRKALPTSPWQFFNCSLFKVFIIIRLSLPLPFQRSPDLEVLHLKRTINIYTLFYSSPSRGLFEIDNPFISPTFPDGTHHWNPATQSSWNLAVSFPVFGATITCFIPDHRHLLKQMGPTVLAAAVGRVCCKPCPLSHLLRAHSLTDWHIWNRPNTSWQSSFYEVILLFCLLKTE